MRRRSCATNAARRAHRLRLSTPRPFFPWIAQILNPTPLTNRRTVKSAGVDGRSARRGTRISMGHSGHPFSRDPESDASHMDGTQMLGQRIVEAARLLVAAHLHASLDDVSNFRQQVVIGG